MFKKKRITCVLLSALMMGTVFSGCTNLVTTNNEKDMKQVVATVDISASEDFAAGGRYQKYADAISSQDVLKRDLIALFLNQGYSLVQSGNYSYSTVFDMMMETLVNRKIVSQYAKVYFFESMPEVYSIDGYKAVTSASATAQIEGIKYFLTEDEIALAEYSARKAINNTIDSAELSYITDLSSASYTSSVRTLPTGVDEEKEDYFDPAYRIYTGKNSVEECGSYEAQEGSTPTTRKKAYNSFLSSLKNNYLLLDGERNLDDIESFDYWNVELLSQLETSLIQKLGDSIEEDAGKALTKEFVESKYEEIFFSQQKKYDTSVSDFETDISSLSDSSFVLYSPVEGYGFVYNILLPFSASESAEYERVKNKNYSQEETYRKRAEILEGVRATDQRGSWLTGETDYSFSAAEKGVSVYGDSDKLFFENNLLKGERYEELGKYYGHYAYNGKVEVDETDKDNHGYTLTPNKLSIDGFIDEMEAYFAFAGIETSGTKNEAYMLSLFDENDKVDYSAFLYYSGKAKIDFDANDTFVKDSSSYTAMAMVNELMFAYNTDTAGLNSYLGYSVSAYDTNFVKEFEYAAKAAVAGGVGTYTVAPSDYGWHIMYCTYTFGEGEVYSFNFDDVENEGTFSYYFYEALKDSTAGNSQKVFETQVVNRYGAASNVKIYKERYADYASLS